MDVLPVAAHRTLAYVALVNRGGARPSTQGVRQFFQSAEPREALTLAAMMEAVAAQRYSVGSGEDPFQYLLRMEWVAVEDNGVTLTTVGQALLRALESADSGRGVIEAVLDVDDPFAYAKAVAYLRTATPALLIDPYLRMPELIELARVPTVQRGLVSTKLKAQELADRGRIAQVVNQERPLEVRKTADAHDRYLVPTVGHVLMLGGSLNTIGHAPITLTSLSDDLSDVVRERYTAMWLTAQPVRPPQELVGPPERPARAGDSAEPQATVEP